MSADRLDRTRVNTTRVAKRQPTNWESFCAGRALQERVEMSADRFDRTK